VNATNQPTSGPPQAYEIDYPKLRAAIQETMILQHEMLMARYRMREVRSSRLFHACLQHNRRCAQARLIDISQPHPSSTRP
jgi:hypothetical protein